MCPTVNTRQTDSSVADCVLTANSRPFKQCSRHKDGFVDTVFTLFVPNISLNKI